MVFNGNLIPWNWGKKNLPIRKKGVLNVVLPKTADAKQQIKKITITKE